ncbi:MAG: right-handed parallel beta-helix repeat-containing protein [Candidatus Thermoplasmatota archaeon]
MEKRIIRYSAFLVAVLLLGGGFSIWAVGTQVTVSVGVGETVDRVEINTPGDGKQLLSDGIWGRPGGIEYNGTMFEINTQSTDYVGNYVVTIYLVNADEAAQHFRYLNVEFDINGDSKFLTLENGRVQWVIQSIGKDIIEVNVTGNGGYLAMSEGLPDDLEFLIDVEESGVISYSLSEGEVLNVDTEEFYDTIQEAIDADNTESGHTILVGSGTYDEDLYVDKDDLSIVSLEGPKNTTIDAGGNDEAVEVRATSFTFEGFTVENVGRYGLNFQNSGRGHKIENNIFNTTGGSAAIVAFSDHDDVIFSNNVMRGAAGVWAFVDCDSWRVSNNVINVSNRDFNGIVGSGSGWNISHNEIKNGKGRGISSYRYASPSDWSITYNVIRDVDYGIKVNETGHEAHYNNIYNITEDYVDCDSSFNATYNWWGTTDETEIGNKMADTVEWKPYLGEAVEDAGTD